MSRRVYPKPRDWSLRRRLKHSLSRVTIAGTMSIIILLTIFFILFSWQLGKVGRNELTLEYMEQYYNTQQKE